LAFGICTADHGRPAWNLSSLPNVLGDETVSSAVPLVAHLHVMPPISKLNQLLHVLNALHDQNQNSFHMEYLINCQLLHLAPMVLGRVIFIKINFVKINRCTD
jgi:hypothetical protein